MKIISIRAAALLALTAVAGTASAQDIITTAGTDWRGFFVGANIGGAWNHTCQSWTPGPAITGNPALATAFYNRNCPNNGNFIGGVDLGYNFQYDQWVWGLKADYDAVGSKSKTRSYAYTSGPTDPIPSGTYTASGKISPNGIGLLGPRIGYAIDEWLPYLRVGGAFAGGQHTGMLSYTPVGGTAPTNSISGGKNFKSTGWNVGAGLDYGFSGGPWSFTAEYNYVNLGKGSNSTFTCATAKGTVPPICTTFANFSLDNIHNSFTMNLFRVGFHYRFGGRSTPEAPVAAAPPPPPAPAPPAPPPPCHAPPGFKVDANCRIIEQSVVVRAVDFEFNLSQLTAPAQQTLDEVASALLTQPDLHVEIQGHTDSIGSVNYNLNLSQRRAEAVKDYLVSKGVSPSNLTAKGYGKAKPIASNDTAEGRAQNRRVEFEVTNVPAHVNVVNKDASAASTEAAQQGEQPKTKKKEPPQN